MAGDPGPDEKRPPGEFRIGPWRADPAANELRQDDRTVRIEPKAMEVLDERWTLLIIRELLLGSTRFNELRRGVPKMSPALLSMAKSSFSVPTRVSSGSWTTR